MLSAGPAVPAPSGQADSPSPAPPAPTPRRGGSRIRAAAPWLVATATLAWLFHVVPIAELRDALGRAPLALLVGMAIAYVLLVLAADAAATWATFRRALPGMAVTYLEVVQVRGASYLLSMLHYSVGQGGVAYLIHRRYNVPLARTAGAVMLTVGVNVIMVALCAGLGLALGGAPANPALAAFLAALGLSFPCYLAVIALRPAFLSRWALLAPLFDAGVRGHLAIAAARLPHIAILIAGNYLAMRLFGVTPPLGKAIALLPVVFVIGLLPISPAGIGTSQATAVTLFSPFVAAASGSTAKAAVLAYSLSWHVLALAIQAATALACLRGAAAGHTSAEAPRQRQS